MKSDLFLSKNIRPMTLIFILIAYAAFALMSYVKLLGEWGQHITAVHERLMDENYPLYRMQPGVDLFLKMALLQNPQPMDQFYLIPNYVTQEQTPKILNQDVL